MNATSEVDRARILNFSFYILGGLLGMMLLGVIATQFLGIIAAIGISLVILVAAFLYGCGIGFLFGLPRVAATLVETPAASAPPQQSTGADREDGANRTASDNPGSKRVLSSNTNLEKISDWLTTMLVGVGLTQLYNVNTWLLGFRQFLEETARVFPNPCTAAGCSFTAGSLPAIGPILLIFGLVAGFLFMYLHTRLVLVRLFQQTETELKDGLPKDAQSAVKDEAQTAAADSHELILTNVASTDAPSIEDAFEVMYTLLYRPKGYTRVIDLGAKLSKSKAIRRPAGSVAIC